MKFTLAEFENWLRERGYDSMMGEKNFKLFLELGFSTLLFYNSNLLFSFILEKIGLKSSGERVQDRARFELAKKIRKIEATKNELELVF